MLMVRCLPLQVWRKGESHPDREGHLHREGGEELTWLPHRKVGECLDPIAKAVPYSPRLGCVEEEPTCLLSNLGTGIWCLVRVIFPSLSYLSFCLNASTWHPGLASELP